jgi:hypothetical protein
VIETTIVCPFCPLACDDIHIVAPEKAGQLPVAKTVCQLARQRFRAALEPAQARIEHQVATLDEIQEHLKEATASSKRVVVITGGVDLATAKGLERLDSSGKIVWVIDQSALTQSWQRTSSRDGVISATFGDVREHADVLWLIGDVESATPRLKELLTTSETPPRVIETPGPLDLDLLAKLSLVTRTPGLVVKQSTIAELVPAILSSKYLAVIVGDGAFAAEFADAALSLLVRWVWLLNEKRRAVVLHVDDAATNRAVYRWRTNRSLGISDDASCDANTLTIRVGESIADHSPVDVAIGTRDPGIDRAGVFIPCSMVGVQEAGAKIRGDGTVTLPLAKIVSSDLPLAVQWIERITA